MRVVLNVFGFDLAPLPGAPRPYINEDWPLTEESCLDEAMAAAGEAQLRGLACWAVYRREAGFPPAVVFGGEIWLFPREGS